MTIAAERPLVRQQEEKRAASIRRRVPPRLLGLLSLALVLLYLLQFHSWISIEQGASADARNPFATPFYLVDNGYLSVLNVSVSCEYLTQTGNPMVRVSKVVARLGFKERQLLPCTTSIAENRPTYGSTSFSVTVGYRVEWLPMHRSQAFRMKSAALADGTYLWVQEQ